MRCLAILKDSFRETLDCKTFWVLFVVSTLLALLAFSVSFTALRPDEALADIARGFDRITTPRVRVRYEVDFKVDAVKEDGKGGYEFRLTASPGAEFHKLVRHWAAVGRGEVKKTDDPVPDADRPVEPELLEKYLMARLRGQQLLRVSVNPEPPAGGALAFRVGVRPERPELLHGAHRMGILFGLVDVRLTTSVAITLAGIERFLADVLAGLAGLLFAVVVTGSFVPDMLQKGRVDILLSRPIRRGSLLAYKYLGGLLYVALSALYLVGGCWLGLAVRTGIWNPSFLLTIPVLTFVFAILYAFSVWVGVLTRSALVAILSTIALWFASSSAGSFAALARSPMGPQNLPPWFETGVNVFHKILPKTFDLKELNNVLILRSHLGEEAASTMPGAGFVDPATWPLLAGSSLVVLAVFLASAIVVFQRRDY